MVTVDDAVFEFFGSYRLHELMLRDESRMRIYQDGILKNSHLFKDKVVLDFGCGSGIMGMLAAKAGAKKIIGIDASKFTSEAKEIIKDNKLEDKMTILEGLGEELDLSELLRDVPGQKVDIITHEVFGPLVLMEGVFQSLIKTRDKWLKPDGVVLPDITTMSICGIEYGKEKEEKVNWWNNVHGFDLSGIRAEAANEMFGRENVDPEKVMTNSCLLKVYDFSKCSEADLPFESEFRLKCSRDSDMHAVAIFFDFAFHRYCKPIVGYSTGPEAEYSHWANCVFFVETPETPYLKVQKGEIITGRVRLEPCKVNLPLVEIDIDLEFNGKLSSMKMSKRYKVNGCTTAIL